MCLGKIPSLSFFLKKKSCDRVGLFVYLGKIPNLLGIIPSVLFLVPSSSYFCTFVTKYV